MQHTPSSISPSSTAAQKDEALSINNTDVDDSHKRWQGEDWRAKQTWQRYDQKVAQQIVHNALQHNDVTLISLYHALSMARSTCERDKQKTGEYSSSDLQSEGVLDQVKSGGFGAFAHGGSFEPFVYKFGDVVKRLFDVRIGAIDNRFFSARGLSSISAMGGGLSLEHPTGSVFEALESTFQQLITTENFFEFLQCSDRLMYHLSNYPPVVRGSAAVNSWIIDKVAKERFGVMGSLRPLLYDWTAFLETPDHYSGFYVISAAVKYLALMPDLYNADKAFYDSIPALMMEDPYKEGVLQRREDAWKKIQANITTYLAEQTHTGTLSEQQRKALITIQEGQLKFRTPSTAMLNFINALTSQDEIETKDALLSVLAQANLSEERLKKLLELNLSNNLSQQYLKHYSDATQADKFNEQWADLEVLRRFPSSKFNHLYDILGIDTYRYKREDVNSGFGYMKMSSNRGRISAHDLKMMVGGKPTFILLDNNVLFYVGDNTGWNATQVMFNTRKSPNIGNVFPDMNVDQWINIPKNILDTYFIDEIPALKKGSLALLARVSFATSEDLAKLPKNILDLFEEYNNTEPLAIHLKDAICSGGVRIQDLPHLSMDQINLISSPEAIALYRCNIFVRAADILKMNAFREASEANTGLGAETESMQAVDSMNLATIYKDTLMNTLKDMSFSLISFMKEASTHSKEKRLMELVDCLASISADSSIEEISQIRSMVTSTINSLNVDAKMGKMIDEANVVNQDLKHTLNHISDLLSSVHYLQMQSNEIQATILPEQKQQETNFTEKTRLLRGEMQAIKQANPDEAYLIEPREVKTIQR